MLVNSILIKNLEKQAIYWAHTSDSEECRLHTKHFTCIILFHLGQQLYTFDYTYFVRLKKQSLKGFKQLFQKVIELRI